MYARLITTHFDPASIDIAADVFEESILPWAREQPGFRGALGLADHATGKSIVVTYWETAADLEATERNDSVSRQIEQASGLPRDAITTETFEVVVHE